MYDKMLRSDLIKRESLNLINFSISIPLFLIFRDFQFKEFNHALFFLISKLLISFISINYIKSMEFIGVEGADGLRTALQQLTQLKQLSIAIEK